MRFLAVIYIILFISSDLYAVEPDEMLDDPMLENIARDIGKKIRCLVCQNEDIENSNADIAKDLRVLIRKKISEGKEKKEIISYIHSRYGDFVLYTPPIRSDTIWLWFFPIGFLILLSFIFFRKKR
tara:strand:+ start:871 stop:1248 length:378 start_codon:yes stop_codon:yes gene_type:complete